MVSPRMTTDRNWRWWFLSLGSHALVLFLLLGIFVTQKRWSGGNPQARQGVVMVSLGGSSAPVAAEKIPAAAEGRNLLKTSPALVDPPKQNQQAGGALRSSGKSGSGDSPTPAGGKGSGIDAGNSTGAPDVLAKIRQKILMARRYPPQALERGLTGVVRVAFAVNDDGKPARVRVEAGSGEKLLDDEALSTIHRAAPLPAYAGEIHLNIRFDLEDE